MPDWKILCDLSTKMGYPMGYQSPAEIMEEIVSLVPFYAGVSYSNLEKGGIQWPSKNGGKKRFSPVEYKGPAEQPDTQYPYGSYKRVSLPLRNRDHDEESHGISKGLS